MYCIYSKSLLEALTTFYSYEKHKIKTHKIFRGRGLLSGEGSVVKGRGLLLGELSVALEQRNIGCLQIPYGRIFSRSMSRKDPKNCFAFSKKSVNAKEEYFPRDFTTTVENRNFPAHRHRKVKI